MAFCRRLRNVINLALWLVACLSYDISFVRYSRCTDFVYMLRVQALGYRYSGSAGTYNCFLSVVKFVVSH